MLLYKIFELSQIYFKSNFLDLNRYVISIITSDFKNHNLSLKFYKLFWILAIDLSTNNLDNDVLNRSFNFLNINTN